MIVYVSIGNSDDKLTQSRWADFQATMWNMIHIRGKSEPITVHGEWMSSPTARFQNACWCLEFPTDEGANIFKRSLPLVARSFDQTGIAWAIAPVTEFL